jgi:hypothetical protein
MLVEDWLAPQKICEVAMTFPDWSTGINSAVTAFLQSPNISGPVTAMIGISVGAVMLSLLLAVFLRKG